MYFLGEQTKKPNQNKYFNWLESLRQLNRIFRVNYKMDVSNKYGYSSKKVD